MTNSNFLSKSTRYKEIATAIIVAVLSFSVLIAGELLLRFDWWNRSGLSAPTYTNSENTLEIPPVDLVTNPSGFRGPEIELKKPDGVLRIAFFGSSSTYDLYSLRDETTWPHQTWITIQSALPGCRFEYINAGRNGYSTLTMNDLYDADVSEYDPDFVVIAANDLLHDLQVLAPDFGLNKQPTKSGFLKRNSLLWRHIEQSASKIRRRRLYREDQRNLDIKYPPAEELSRQFEGRLTRFIEAVKADERIPIIVYIPKMMRKDQEPKNREERARRLYLDRPFIDLDAFFVYEEYYHDVILAVAGKTGAIMLDASDVVYGDEIHFVDSYHLNIPGSARLGKYAGAELAQSKVLLDYFHETMPSCLTKQ